MWHFPYSGKIFRSLFRYVSVPFNKQVWCLNVARVTLSQRASNNPQNLILFTILFLIGRHTQAGYKAIHAFLWLPVNLHLSKMLTK